MLLPIAHENRIDPVMEGGFGSREIARWAAAHYGLVTRRKLQALGLSSAQVDGRIHGGTLVPVAAGVYCVGYRSDQPGQQEAIALAAAGPGAFLSGPTAAAWRAMVEPRPGPVHLIVPHARGTNPAGVVRHVAHLGAGDRSIHRGLPCVSPQRAVMDLPSPQLRQALQWLMRHSIAVEPIVERMHGRRGAKAFRAEAAALIPQLAHTMSELEARFVRLCRAHGLPIPLVNQTRVGRDLLDCTWPGHTLVVELDGRRWHAHRDEQDHARDRRRLLEGRMPFRYSWSDVTRRETVVALEVRRMLARTESTLV